MTVSPQSLLVSLDTGAPLVDPTAWVAPHATLCGPVTVGAESSIWYGAVLRADCDTISIGERANVQDNCVLHAGFGRPISVGNDVSIGHNVTVHGSTIDDRVLIGMGTTLMNGCVVESDVIIGAGSLLSQGFRAPAGALVFGAPARVVRMLSADEKARVSSDAAVYVGLTRRHRQAWHGSP